MGERLPYKQRVTGSSPVSSIYESLAQSVEHLTFNQRVDSSSLSRLIVNFAGVAELADALDLGSSVLMTWGFKSLHPHHIIYADLAQLAEHLICNQGVGGSNPLVGTRMRK